MRFYFPRTSCYVLTEFARLDCVIISLVIRLTSVSGPRSTAPQRQISGTRPSLYVVALGKESTVDKQERGVKNCLLEVIFYSRDFNLASYARVIDICVTESRSFDTFASFTWSALDSIHQNHLGREGLRWNDGQLMTCYTN